MKLIDKNKLLEELKKLKQNLSASPIVVIEDVESLVESLEVKDPYEQCVQHDSIKAGIQAHAETYSFNIESVLFPQLTKEQQKLWRKEIEQACISGGEVGVELARDTRYKENVEVKEVDLDGISRHYALNNSPWDDCRDEIQDAYKAGFELGVQVSNKAQKGEKV